MFNMLYNNAIDVAMDRGPVGVHNNAPMSFTAIAGDDVAGMVACHGAMVRLPQDEESVYN